MMDKSSDMTLKVGARQAIASADLIALAQQHCATDRGGELQEQRFRRFGDAEGRLVWIEVDVTPVNPGGTLTRMTILRGTSAASKRGRTKIAEYEEVRTLDRDRAAAGLPDATSDSSPPREEIAKSPPADQSTADIRRSQIVEGACEVISRKGYAEASVREIAEASGVSIPSLYQYVKSKEDILFLITEGCMQRLFDEFRETIGAALSADAKIEKAIADYLAYISDNRRYINLVYRETRSLSPENRERIFDIERALMKEWETIVRAGIRSGAFRRVDPFVASNILYFACSVWALRHWALAELGEEKVRKGLIELMLDGLRK